ncbi:MAG TPA: bifunctional (p)ppGpp synthetase/guanosine-3',5'-bis(diphosphate) 3'-pyrophosphohydrolase [Clostridia bacterium]|nr:bifunctional (p)ppGpp synthetase/guanosine-3',5'-bis(diphosphate) 3'-pyrophosphohydrolase [Clostridia bacterium]
MLKKLENRVLEYNPKADLDFIREAYELAREAHDGQKRISGQPFITHPVAVAEILAELELDLDTLAGALLHDVVEDTDVSLSLIGEKFGSEVALLVDGVTKLGRLEYKSKEEQQAENLRKMFLAMAKDIRVILIKLADRLHNLRTLRYHPEEKQKEIAHETLEIFAPLAHRLGIYRIKWELEDIAFRHLAPKKYYDLVKQVAETRSKREEYINKHVVGNLAEKLIAVGIEATIEGRPKHLYSIYEKMESQKKEFNEILDVLAVRVLVETVKDCYGALGIAHTIWKPIPGRFKDYVAMPKSNMYQSLHTTVIGLYGEPLEIQIRTWEMHRTAEYGIAAHWLYKEGGRGDRKFAQKMAWLRRILEWQSEIGDTDDAREFMEGLKIDLFSDSVYVFTPRGDVLELSTGSVPIDFAYRIHTEVGHRCTGARVNGRIVPLDYKLKNGDIVEIITGKNKRPSRDWLNIVKTSQAKNKIRQWYKKERRDENIIRGKETLERELRKHNLDQDLIKSDKLVEIGAKFNLKTLDDVYAAVGDGTVTFGTVIARLREGAKKDKQAIEEELKAPRPISDVMDKRRPVDGIRVKGEENLLVRLAQCCNPVPGDPVSGFVTRGRGVSVHRNDCRNIIALKKSDPQRVIGVEWEDVSWASFQVKLEVIGLDRAGLLSDVMAVLKDLKINATWVTGRAIGKDRLGVIELVIQAKSLDQLENIISKLGRVKDVYDVKRASFASERNN